MEETSETYFSSHCVDLAYDTSVPVAHLAEFSSACKSRERVAINAIGKEHDSRTRIDSIRNAEQHVNWALEVELRIALTTLMNSDNAEPFLCDHRDYGLLGLRTIRKRLAEGRYVVAKVFWSDVDECLSICGPVGRHPFMVWEMRTLFQQLEEDFGPFGCRKEVSLALRSAATTTFARSDKIERCYESGTWQRSALAISKDSHLGRLYLHGLGLKDTVLSKGPSLVDIVCDARDAFCDVVVF